MYTASPVPTAWDQPLTVAEIMSPLLVSALHTLPVSEAAHAMATHGFRHLPVRDHRGSLVGIVSDRDVRLAASWDPSEDDAPVVHSEVPVWQIMSVRVITVSREASVGEAAHLLRQHRVGALVVVEGERPVGVVSAHDLLGLLSPLA